MFLQRMLGDEELTQESRELIEERVKSDGVAGITVGRVTKIESNKVYIDIGGKYDSVAPLSEFRVNGKVSPPEVGTDIEVWKYTGGAALSRERAIRSILWEDLRQSHQSTTPVVGRILSEEFDRKTFNVDISGVHAILPFARFDSGQITTNYKSFIGSEIPMLITEIKTQEDPIKLSCKINKEQIGVTEGQSINGVITEILYNGMVVTFTNNEDNEITGWLSVANAYAEGQPLADAFKVGDTIQASVLRINENGKAQLRRERFSWDEVQNQFKQDTVWKGRVEEIIDCGIRVTLPNPEGSYDTGIIGLIYIDDTCGIKGLALKRFFTKNKIIEVRVKQDVDHNRRISLTIRDTECDPWRTVQLKVGDVIECNVGSVFNNRAFLNITDQLDGLLRLNNYQLWQLPKVGDKMNVTVLEFNPSENKLIFIPGTQQLEKQEEMLSKLSQGSQIEVEIQQVITVGYGSYGLYVCYDNTLYGFVKRESISKSKKLTDYAVGEKLITVVEFIETKDRFLLLSIRGSEKRVSRENKSEKSITFGEIVADK